MWLLPWLSLSDAALQNGGLLEQAGLALFCSANSARHHENDPHAMTCPHVVQLNVSHTLQDTLSAGLVGATGAAGRHAP